MQRYTSIFIIFIAFISGYMPAQNDLNYYATAAKKNSPLIIDNKNQSEAAKIEIERIKAFYTKPQVTLNAGASAAPIISNDNGQSRFLLSPSDATTYVGYDIAASNGGIYQAMINVNQPLFNAGKYNIASQQVAVAGQINQNAIQLTSHDVEKFVTDQYVLCLQDLKQTDYVNKLLEIISEQKTIVNKLVENGLLKQSDMLLVNIEYQTQLNIFNAYRSTYRRDLMDLNVLCGISDTSLQKIQDLDLTINPAVSQSRFTERFRLDSLNLVAQQKNFELRYKPQLSAFANAGLNGVYVPTLPNRFGLSAGINFAWYIYDGKQKNLNQKKTDVLVKTTQAYKSNFLTQNSVRKNRILAELSAINARLVISENQLNDYKQLLDYYKKELLTGQQSVVTYITTVKNLAVFQRDYILLQTNKQLLINTYNYWNW